MAVIREEGPVSKNRKRKLFAVLFESQRGMCAYCRCQMVEPEQGEPSVAPNTATFDHLKPRSLGGPDDEGNLVLACAECNAAKGSAYEGGRDGPTPEELVRSYEDQADRLVVKSHLYELERMLLSAAASSQLPRQQKDNIWLVYKFWEYQLLHTDSRGRLKHDIQQSGMFLRDRAIAQCWVPLPDVDTYHSGVCLLSAQPKHKKHRTWRQRRS